MQISMQKQMAEGVEGCEEAMSLERAPKEPRPTPKNPLRPRRSLYFDQPLALKLFSEFSRFEYALKEAGYVRKHKRHGTAEPAWPMFEEAVEESYRLEEDTEFAGAVEYLFSASPRVQVRKGEALDWKPLKRGERTDIQWLTLLVRTVRNNLFHGSKYAYYSQEELDHDTVLVKSSLIVLKALASWNTEVSRHFEQPQG